MLNPLNQSILFASRRTGNSKTSTPFLKSGYWLRVSLLIVVIVAIFVNQVNSQMTFSDGWGKRSVMFKEMRRLAPSPEDANKLDKTMVNAALDRCHNAYSQSLVKLHEQIMNMYDSYQRCQDRVIAIHDERERRV